MIQATGRVATSIVDGLKSSPLALPLVVVNLLALGLVAFTLSKISDRSEARDALIIKLAQECRS